MINGPNLDLLGTREPQIYGNLTLGQIQEQINSWIDAQASSTQIDYFQSNLEGEIIEKLNGSHNLYDALVINPGALCHYSVALVDSLIAFPHPKVEVHLSNPFKRELFRRRLLTAGVVDAVILGAGAYGYILALDFLLKKWGAKQLEQ